MARYSACYREPLTGRVETITRSAAGYLAALHELPRWIYPNGKPLRRVGAPTIEQDTSK